MPFRPRRSSCLTVCLTLLASVLADSALGSNLFWNITVTGGDRIEHCDVASCTPTNFVTGLSAGLQGDIAIDPIEGMVYWAVSGTNAGTAKIQRKSLSGGLVQDMLDMSTVPSSGVTGIAVDPVARHVYVATPGTSPRIRRFSIDSPGSSTPVVLFNEAGCSSCSPQGLAVDLTGGHLYWTDQANGKIARRTLDLATPIQDVVPGLTLPNGLALDPANDRIYFIDGSSPRRIRYAPFSSPTTISHVIDIPGSGCAGCLELDSAPGALGQLYLSTIGGPSEIRRCDLDAGCGALTLLTGGVLNGLGLALLQSSPIPALGAGGTAVTVLVLLAATYLLQRRGQRSRAR